MSIIIQDGTGTKVKAEVSADNKLEVSSVGRTEQQSQSLAGKAFQIGSGIVNLTSASESAVLYLKNNENSDLLLTAINVTSTKQTGSSAGVFTAYVYKGPTGLSASTSKNAVNNNFGSAITLDATIAAGQEGASVTNGTAIGAFYIQEAEFFNTDISWVVPKGTSIAISIIPGASNTNLNITITAEAVLKRT